MSGDSNGKGRKPLNKKVSGERERWVKDREAIIHGGDGEMANRKELLES